MEFVTVKIHRNKLGELRKLKARLMAGGKKVSDAETIETALEQTLKHENLQSSAAEESEFQRALENCQKAFSDFTEKDWNEFEKAARFKWKPTASF